MRLYQLSKNANVVELGNMVVLFSYSEAIGMYNDDDILYLVKNWSDYSNTTNKHVYEFLRDYLSMNLTGKRDIENLIAQNKIKLVDSL